MTNANQNTFVFDLLTRCAEIQRTINVVTPDAQVYAVKWAYPRWFAPIGNNGYPGFYNKAARLSSTRGGRPIRKDVYRVTMRLVVGPAFAGYQGEYEDAGNIIYSAILNAFDAQQRLAVPSEPPDNEPLQFVESALIQPGDLGLEGKVYEENPRTAYICLDVPMDVTANFQVYRQS